MKYLNIYTTLLFSYGFLHLMSMREIFGREGSFACRLSERAKFVFSKCHAMLLQNLKYKRFIALTQSCSNELGNSLYPFFISMRFYRRGYHSIEWYPRRFHRNSLSVSFRYFSSRLFFRPLIYQTKMGREDATVAIITLLPRPNHS